MSAPEPPQGFPPCEECGHYAWSHGTQTGTPIDGEECCAGVWSSDEDDELIQCPCAGYRHPGESVVSGAPVPGERPARAVLWNAAGSLTMRIGTALHHAGLALCGLAGNLDARADDAGYWNKPGAVRRG